MLPETLPCAHLAIGASFCTVESAANAKGMSSDDTESPSERGPIDVHSFIKPVCHDRTAEHLHLQVVDVTRGPSP